MFVPKDYAKSIYFENAISFLKYFCFLIVVLIMIDNMTWKKSSLNLLNMYNGFGTFKIGKVQMFF
jgi:hypothetical protein